MEYSFFVTNVVKHVVVADFEPILNTADIMDTTADAVQKAVHTVTPNYLIASLIFVIVISCK